ncbi:DUF551 domain-containing protein [Acinetobacter indicus]|uniref:DUF551 domain-containing protein n=1 Tax=Acinetobacter indicus TaxID=756892 RepID=UPI000948DF06|nr:DUF551 domain-containing protein [Acinetobacter indicus]
MDIQRIKELALANGFKLKEQVSGNMDLNAYVYDFANAIEREVKAQAVPEWISVEDNLPEFDVPVLATNMKFKEGKFWWVFERCDSDDGWVWSRFGSCLNEAYCDDYEITHWMPLPNAPQEPAND